MKKSNLLLVFVLLNSALWSISMLACQSNSGESKPNGPKEWFETYIKSDSAAYNWRQNHVKNIDWEKAVVVKDAFDNEGWEIPVESKMYFGYMHTVTSVNGKKAEPSELAKSARIISPFQVHLLITKNKVGGFEGRVLNYFAPSFDSTQQYPSNLNQLDKYSDCGINISEFSGKPDYSLYYGDHIFRSLSTTSSEKSAVLKAKLPVMESGDNRIAMNANLTTDWHQKNSSDTSATGWKYTNSATQYFVGNIN